MQTYENIQEGNILLSDGQFQNVKQWYQYLLNVKSHQMTDPQGDTYGLNEVLFCPEFTQYEDGKCKLQKNDAIISN